MEARHIVSVHLKVLGYFGGRQNIYVFQNVMKYGLRDGFTILD